MTYSSNFSEKELLNDLLMSEKQVTSSYNSSIIEAGCSTLRTSLNTCLENVLNCQFEILDAMNQRGWHQSKEADSNDIENAIRKFSKMFSELK